MKIEGTVAIVTGGASGIGHAFCVALLENGAKSVNILDICTENGEKVQKQFESQYGPGSATFIKCDVTNKEELEQAFKQTVVEHGKLDILCNNAGIYDEKNWEKTIALNLAKRRRTKPATPPPAESEVEESEKEETEEEESEVEESEKEETEEEESEVEESEKEETEEEESINYEKAYKLLSRRYHVVAKAYRDTKTTDSRPTVCLIAVVRGTFLGLEFMQSGVIVNTSSEAGLCPLSLGPVYSTTKHGVVGLTRSVAPVSQTKGIRVNCVCPGGVETAMTEKVILENPEMADKLRELKMIKPEEVAKGLIQLIKDDTKNGEALLINAQSGTAYHQFPTQNL